MATRAVTNRELRQRRAEVVKEMELMIDQGQITGSTNRSKFDLLEAEARNLSARINEMEGSGARTYEFRGGQPTGYGHGEHGTAGAAIKREDDPQYRKAFGQYIRRGVNDMEPDLRGVLYQRRDMSEGVLGGAYPTSSTGFFVPVGFVDRIEDSLKYYGPMLNGGQGMPTIMETATGQPMPYPAADDTSSVGEQVGEGQQVTTQDVNIQQVMFGAWKYSSKLVKVSIELLQDSAFDFETWLIQEFARRLGRILNQLTTTGVGTTQPMGIITSVVNGGNLVTAVGANSNDGASGANTIGSDDLTNLEHQVDPVYRPGAKYMMNDSVLKAIKKVKDKYGRPLWQESTRDGSPATINGYEYAINNNMDVLQTNASSPTVTRNCVCFGALEKFVIRRVKEMSVLRLSERFADFGQIAFIAFARYDSNSIDIGNRALAVLRNIY